MSRPLLVGQAPSRDTDGGLPFSGRSGRRLAALAGFPHADLGARFELANVLDRWPGKAARGDRFPAREARAAAARLPLAGRRVVFVGAGVAAAFGARPPAPLAWFDHAGARCALLPHPSGVNRWWNDPAHAAAAAAFLRDLT